ncbi:MAG TPA: IclR family transcriptional regulator [Acidimicrobiales bacterium]|nr:IclR family transcriptional regulator [Actinomycetes bacterium]HVN51375.1 IclR family transcriptional regulator [Acidimicrobiales bacterium]
MPTTPGRSVTSKVVAILGSFQDGPSTLSLTEIATAADLPMPTAHRLVGELVERGVLRRDDSGRYRVGRFIWRIAQNAGRELRDSARRHLADLFAATGETCLLAIRDGEQVLVIDRIYGTADQAHVAKAGDRRPLHTSATGQVLLAYEEPWLQRAYLDRLGGPEARRLTDSLAQVRQRGYAAVVEEAQAGCTLAVPVLLDSEHAVAAIGLVAPSTRQLDRRVRLLTQAARRMEPEARRWPNTRVVASVFEHP